MRSNSGLEQTQHEKREIVCSGYQTRLFKQVNINERLFPFTTKAPFRPGPRARHQSEHSLLLVPEHKFENRARAFIAQW